LVALFPFLYCCHDRHARPHRLALLQHEKRAALSAHARLFDRLTGHLQPPRVSAAQEVFWYAVYAAALWIAVAFLALVYGAKAWSPYKTSRRVGDSAGS